MMSACVIDLSNVKRYENEQSKKLSPYKFPSYNEPCILPNLFVLQLKTLKMSRLSILKLSLTLSHKSVVSILNDFFQ